MDSVSPSGSLLLSSTKTFLNESEEKIELTQQPSCHQILFESFYRFYPHPLKNRQNITWKSQPTLGPLFYTLIMSQNNTLRIVSVLTAHTHMYHAFKKLSTLGRKFVAYLTYSAGDLCLGQTSVHKATLKLNAILAPWGWWGGLCFTGYSTTEKMAQRGQTHYTLIAPPIPT